MSSDQKKMLQEADLLSKQGKIEEAIRKYYEILRGKLDGSITVKYFTIKRITSRIREAWKMLLFLREEDVLIQPLDVQLEYQMMKKISTANRLSGQPRTIVNR